jgi:phage major head subunit gpT-like protein
MNAFAVWRGAFTTSLTADGSPLVGSHTLIKTGESVSNAVSGPLTNANLELAVIALREQKDQSGVIRGSEAKYLLVPSALFPEAIRITESVLVSDTGNNGVNVFRSKFGIEVMSSPYLGAAAGGSDTAWFLVSEFHAVKRIVRQAVQTALTSWEYSDNRTYKYQGNFREVVVAFDWAGVVGSTGV